MIVILNPKILIGQETGNRSMLTGLECVPAGAITITEFEDSKGKKDWKIVVGREFKYEGQKQSAGQWTWGIGTDAGTSLSNPWSAIFTPKNVGTKEYEGKGIIPTAGLPLKNSDFGSTRGKVKVSNASSETGDADIKVFFIKNDVNNISSTTEPNWFFYWKQSPLIQNLLTLNGFHLYDLQSCAFNPSPTMVTLSLEYAGATYPYSPPPATSNTYAANFFKIENMSVEDLFQITNGCAPISDPTRAIVGYGNLTKIQIGEGCGFQKAKNTCNPASLNHEGIHTLYTTVVHEVEHAIIKCEVWSFTDSSDPLIGPGYLSSYDSDGDGYKDLWEKQVGMLHGFKIKIKPTDPDDTYIEAYQACYCTNSCSRGTQYEEKRCRDKEALLNTSLIDPSDWSFDDTTKHQGKQW